MFVDKDGGMRIAKEIAGKFAHCAHILCSYILCSHLMLISYDTYLMLTLFIYQTQNTGPKGYFLIIDKLNETLDTRIKRWKKEKRKALSKNGKKKRETVVTKGLKTLATKRLSAEDISRQESMANYNGEISEDQVDVALQMASALMYLHGKNIMFRDLKPQNVGFDVRGDVKVSSLEVDCVVEEMVWLYVILSSPISIPLP